MQVVLLCGGRGTRIRGEVADAPKPLLPVGGRPIVSHLMDRYAAFGLRDFVLLTGHRAEDFERAFAPGSPHHPAGARVTLLPTGEDAQTGTRLRRFAPRLQGDCCMMSYGDCLADVDLRALLDFHAGHGRAATLTAVRPPSRWGELVLEDGRVAAFKEKPKDGQPPVNGGFMVLDRRVFELLDELDGGADREDLVFEQEPLARLAADGELMAFEHDGFWQPMDTYREWQVLEELWSAGHPPWVREA